LSFGLPSNLLPFTTESELKTGNHKNWVQRRILKEDELKRGKEFCGIELPGRSDVLLGPGKPIQDHPGNQRLHELVRLYMDEYNQASRSGGRTIVARKILLEILSPSSNDPKGTKDNSAGGGGRFLKRQDENFKFGWWEEVTDEDVLVEKVANAVRGVRKRSLRNSKSGRVKEVVRGGV
jgi:hypothetical protein